MVGLTVVTVGIVVATNGTAAPFAFAGLGAGCTTAVASGSTIAATVAASGWEGAVAGASTGGIAGAGTGVQWLEALQRQRRHQLVLARPV